MDKISLAVSKIPFAFYILSIYLYMCKYNTYRLKIIYCKSLSLSCITYQERFNLYHNRNCKCCIGSNTFFNTLVIDQLICTSTYFVCIFIIIYMNRVYLSSVGNKSPVLVPISLAKMSIHQEKIHDRVGVPFALRNYSCSFGYHML